MPPATRASRERQGEKAADALLASLGASPLAEDDQKINLADAISEDAGLWVLPPAPAPYVTVPLTISDPLSPRAPVPRALGALQQTHSKTALAKAQEAQRLGTLRLSPDELRALSLGLGCPVPPSRGEASTGPIPPAATKAASRGTTPRRQLGSTAPAHAPTTPRGVNALQSTAPAHASTRPPTPRGGLNAVQLQPMLNAHGGIAKPPPRPVNYNGLRGNVQNQLGAATSILSVCDFLETRMAEQNNALESLEARCASQNTLALEESIHERDAHIAKLEKLLEGRDEDVAAMQHTLEAVKLESATGKPVPMKASLANKVQAALAASLSRSLAGKKNVDRLEGSNANAKAREDKKRRDADGDEDESFTFNVDDVAAMPGWTLDAWLASLRIGDVLSNAIQELIKSKAGKASAVDPMVELGFMQQLGKVRPHQPPRPPLHSSLTALVCPYLL